MKFSPLEMVKRSPSTLSPDGPDAVAPAADAAPAVQMPATYEAALVELESLVTAMEAGRLPLEELLVSYRRGADLLGFCRSRLAAVESQVKVYEEGRLAPWTDA